MQADHGARDALDVLVVGSGVAGLSTAIALAGRRRVAVVSKEVEGGGSTVLAQGGIAAALAPGDSWAAHAADTVAAAAGLGDPEVAGAVTAEAAEAVGMLARLGVRFDAGALAREGGHSAARVVHARGDATGAEISHALLHAARSRDVAVVAGVFLVDLLLARGGSRVVGALLWDSRTACFEKVRATTVVLATGGYGHLWAGTTSPPACSGDGLAAALRAGAQVADLEFVQFHPTGMLLGRDPRPLASEALRGAGARLRDSNGEYLHPASPPGKGDLEPRDVVSRSMARRMSCLRSEQCWLDATALGPEALERHFPTFVSACRAAGILPERDWAPVSPTAHYTMGGVLTDGAGRTTLEGLMAVGEVACSGLHGANRLASNSLLEGAVIGRRAARAVLADAPGPVAPRGAVPVDELAAGPGPEKAA
ncbi:MAG: L-aspartate oxidase, partial [Acidimicrobiales bacterium]